VRVWLKMVFAVVVISGWFLVALWMILSVMQLGMLDRTGGGNCTVSPDLEVSCAPHA